MLLRRVRRWATAGLIAAVGIQGKGALAQDGVALPPISSIPVMQSPAVPPTVVRGAMPASVLPATPAVVPIAPPPASPGLNVPDLGAHLVPAAPPSHGGVGMVETGCKTGDCAPKAKVGECPGCGNPGCSSCGGAGAGDRFAKVPPVMVLPRVGWFPITPTGPGYYSVLDQVTDTYRQAPPKYPYPRFALIINPFFDIDWRYLDDPNNTETDYADFLKRQRFGPNDMFMFTTGGEVRARYHYEANSRLLNAGPIRNRGRDNTYDQYRVRLYTDLFITEKFRIFAEFISATNPDRLLPPLLIDRNGADFLNLFVDAQVMEIADKPLWFRVGRQELMYGSQRLISPLDWANTRRTFQGGKLFWRGDKDDLDAFFVQPVIPNDHALDSVDNNVVFGGVWYTHRPKPGDAIDAYYLMRDDSNRAFDGKGRNRGGESVHTFGSRWVGDRNNWLWDFEGMVQTGEHVDQKLFARALTAGGGYHFKDVPWTPILWGYYDYASGTPNPSANGVNSTFNQLFPFGHYYFGWIDIVGRRNINDLSAMLTFWPTKWWVTQLQCHNFWLDSRQDALYNAAGVPIRRDPSGKAGSYVGTELDLIMNFHLSKHTDILCSYSYMWAGRFIEKTATTQAGKQDPQALYLMYNYRW